jgi:uncharacterized lipoprotein YmbA
MTRSRLIGTSVALLICGCASSPPLRYYVLSEPPAGGSASASPVSEADAVQVTKITLPRELDRSELVQRVDATRVHVAEDDQWAAPLDDLIRRALTADLRHHAGARRAGQVSVQIESFNTDKTCAVELYASWEWREPGSSTPSERGRAEIQLPSASQGCPISEVPVRMSEALTQLADRMLDARSNAK